MRSPDTHSHDSTYDQMLVHPSPRPGAHLLVAIDHREARIYRIELHGSVPQRITPYDPYDFGRHLHYVQDNSNGQRKPERASFYNEVAKNLQGAGAILVFGHGIGASSAMRQLLAALQRRYKDLAMRVIGSVAVDGTHLSDAQLLARAREFYSEIGPAAGRG